MFDRGILHVPVSTALLAIVSWVGLTGHVLADGASYAALAPADEGDGHATITYNPENGEVGVIAGPSELTFIAIESALGMFTGGPAENLDGTFDEFSDTHIEKVRFCCGFGSTTFGNVAESGLTEEFVRNDLTATGSPWLLDGPLGVVDLVYISAPTPLQAGDADTDFDFDQFDLVQVQQAAKYQTGQPATWGEGDWNGAPGGSPDAPPAGDGVFDNLDIVAALQTGNYMQESYAASGPGYGNDLPVTGSLAGGVDDGGVELIYVPEPSTFLLSAIAMVGLIAATRRKRG